MFEYLFTFSLILVFSVCFCDPRPNIVVILADDVGRNDFSLHGSSQIPTPNIDALAYNGIILNRHYTLHICTPSRAALLTGNYPIRTGLQGAPLASGEPRSLPLSFPTIAEKLSDLDYTTHLIGKWHLGHQNRSVTPLGRGFHTHLGYWSGFVGYFDYRIYEDNRFDGFDLHDGHYPARKYSGIYATDLFTNEAVKIIKSRSEKPFFLLVNHLAGHTGKNGTALEVPNIDEVMKKYSYIDDPLRRIYAEIIVRLDKSVGEIVKTLSDEKILDNTIVVFMSDNGAKPVGYYENRGSTWPLRGMKSTLYEGGVRNSGIIWSKYLTKRRYVENKIFHITDWFPTIYSAAGGNVSELNSLDGENYWPFLSRQTAHQRSSDVLLNIDENTGLESLISSNGSFKILKGTFQNYTIDNYYGDSGKSNKTPKYDVKSVLNSAVNNAVQTVDNFPPLTEAIVLNLRNQLKIKESNGVRGEIKCVDYCLFNLEEDPTETTDISGEYPEIVQKLSNSLNEYRKYLVPQTNKPVDPNSNPIYCFDNYFTWLDPVYKCTT